MRESAVNKKLRDVAKKLRGRAIRIQRTGVRGDVDYILVLPEGVTVYVECKRPGEVPRPSQVRRHNWLKRRSHLVFVFDGTNLNHLFTLLLGLPIIKARRA